ncbi:hypothetical protein ASG01_11485 [Chryseobacterium sp. Leaf180]|uniref:DUF2752 domain-containing protein n=1 Tax=Chryseobacterium sp. Leaf180 TaxID=1736289 RepID=UPI000700E677|nr:DUF2752 domain-containing protein [Chryseobacterium sp. Leaf180]KQR92529.1 hypothetical protein ASG01_11485 [Chryseobacterium sp. Leaf180]
MKIEDFMLPCPSKKFLGIECFGCGTQRALLMVFQGKFSEAFHMFPAVYTLILFLFFAGLGFLDKKRNYNVIIITLAVLNSLIMIISYFYKHLFVHLN